MDQEYSTNELENLQCINSFRLIGYTLKIRVIKQYKAAGYIPSIKGISNKGTTCARLVDIIIID